MNKQRKPRRGDIKMYDKHLSANSSQENVTPQILVNNLRQRSHGFNQENAETDSELACSLNDMATSFSDTSHGFKNLNEICRDNGSSLDRLASIARELSDSFSRSASQIRENVARVSATVACAKK